MVCQKNMLERKQTRNLRQNSLTLIKHIRKQNTNTYATYKHNQQKYLNNLYLAMRFTLLSQKHNSFPIFPRAAQALPSIVQRQANICPV